MHSCGGMAVCGYTLLFGCLMWARAAALAYAVRRCRVRSAQRCRTETPAAERPRGHWPAQQRGALAQARRSAPRQGTSCCLPASSPSYWQPRIPFGSTRCWPCGLFFYKHLLVKGMKLLHHIPDTNLSAAETEAAPQAGSKCTGTAVRQEARWYGPSSVLRSELRTRLRTCIVPATHAACGAPPSGCCLAPGSE